MKALVLTAYKQLEIQDVPTPEPGAGEILVRVRACGICGSDVHGFDGSTGRRRPPIIMGHEASGVVAKIGDGVSRFRPGDRVTFDSTIYCGRCEFCRQGRINLCENRRVLGVSCAEYRQDGAFAEYVVVPEHIAYRLPDSVSFEQAALIEPLSVALHAVDRGNLRLGETVLVIGGGMIGSLIVQLVKVAGASHIVVLEPDPFRQELVRHAGATAVFSPNESWREELSKVTGGKRITLVFDAVGIDETVRTAVESVEKGGRVVLVGNLAPQTTLLLQAVVTRELTLLGSCASQGDYPRCLDLLARGVVTVDPLISAVAPLEEGPYWFEQLYQRKQPLLKVILQP
ncbi:MAG: galactitol-1-phosphate 5-dehydrogenase [Thermogutta sp.]|uniref:galactitol-1-phosphate 5-dehydrogenase n=1 Tax=Thermogutta sp. TaxID=1962930 RepID=UPI0019862141|nr:galactitol-1-phosphate 5-dehydrogenase [Thermogutta sp.]MBC7352274.1 galactitol-1-phosphate 5-dehydrogenase [Thermogutta sp.]